MSENSHAIYRDVLIEASSKEVFDAITLPEKLIQWWPLKCSGNPEFDAEYNFFFSEEYNWFGKVSKVESNKTFHIEMTDADADWNPTSFGFELEEIENGVMLHFCHKGWPENNHHFRRSSYCWALLLNGLKNFLEKEVVVPFEERS